MAHHLETLLHTGEVGSFAEIARLGHVHRFRVAQIMSLLNLAPDVQEAVLHLPREDGRPSLLERQLRRVAGEAGRLVVSKNLVHLSITSSFFEPVL